MLMYLVRFVDVKKILKVRQELGTSQSRVIPGIHMSHVILLSRESSEFFFIKELLHLLLRCAANHYGHNS